MPKAKTKTVVVKCECNVCKQVAFVVPGTQHYHCNGIKVVKQLIHPFWQGLHHPDSKRKGIWLPWMPAETNVPLAAE